MESYQASSGIIRAQIRQGEFDYVRLDKRLLNSEHILCFGGPDPTKTFSKVM